MSKRICWAIVLLLLLPLKSFAAISFITSVVDEGNDDRSTLTVPAATQAGDVLITQVTFRNRNGSDGVTTPSGWTLVAPQDQDSDVFQSVYYRVAGNGEAGNSYLWDFDGNGNRRYITGMSVFRGVDNVTPIASEASSTAGAPFGSLSAPSLNMANPNSMLVTLFTLEAGDRSFSTPLGMTESYDEEQNNTNNGISSMVAYQLIAGTGLTGTRVTTVQPIRNDDGIAHSIALNEGATGPEIVSVNTSCSNLNTLVVTYSEDVEVTSAENIANYSLTNAAGNNVGIASITLSATDVVTIVLGNNLNDLTPYTLTINNVEDLDGIAIEADSIEAFQLSCEINCITDNFVGPGPLNDSWSVGNSAGSFGDPRIVDDGRMRLTDASGNVATYATLLNQFPGAENRIEIEFDFYAYSGNGADGIAVNFSDASIPPQAGASGGSLGYAQKTGVDGFAGGWLGIGIDEYGNFSNPTEGRVGGTSRVTDSISIRGSGSGTNGYPFITGTSSLSPGIDQSGSTPNPMHRYRIIIDHTAGGGVATVSVERDTGSGYSFVIPTFNIFSLNASQAAVPENWVVSFTGSTGGSTNIHEIGDLKVCAAQPISVYSTVDHYHISHANNVATCEAAEVTITAHDVNHNPSPVLADTPLTITTLPAVESIISSPVILPECLDVSICSPSTTVYLNQSSPLADININVTDGTITDLEGSAEDPWISFLDAVLRFYADGANTDSTPINSQIAGKPSATAPFAQALEIRAVQTNTDTMECEAGLSGPQTIGIGYSCKNPASCSAVNMNVTGTGPLATAVVGSDDAATISYSSVPLTFNAQGQAPFIFDLPDVGRIQLHAQANITQTAPEPDFVLNGSSNEFVVRPFAFDMDFLTAPLSSGGISDPDAIATSAGDSGFVAAGENTLALIRSVSWQAVDDGNSDGQADGGVNLADNAITPNFGQASINQDVLFTSAAQLPAGGDPGSISPVLLTTRSAGSSTFSAGLREFNLNWSEVGILSLAARLEDYLGIAGLDVLGGQKNNIGRFYPASFNLVLPLIPADAITESCGDFSYMGQDNIELNFDIEARNTIGDVTVNYRGDFAKASLSLVAEDTNDGGDYGARLDGFPGLVASDWDIGAFGVLALNADLGRFERGLVLDGPYENLQLGIQLADNDGDLTVLDNLDMNAALDDADCGALNNCDAKLLATTDVRFGVLHLDNAFGPEEFDLDVAVTTRYFDGTRFITNSDDNCTLLDIVNYSAITASWTGNLDAADTAPSLLNNIVAGNGQFQFDRAGNGNNGSVQFEYAAPVWLQTENDDDGDFQDDPFSTITFGQFRGTDRIIYWRENINP